MSVENPAAFLRLFIAVTVPPDVRQEIGRVQGRLKRDSPPGAVRWTPPDQFHVTLKFLGDVPAEQVDALEKSAAVVCVGFPAPRLSSGGIGFFPGPRKPRVIWAGVTDEGGQLSQLHRRLDEALQWLAPAEAAGKFAGHITLGRFKPGHHVSIPKVVELAADFQARHFGAWHAREVELVRSDLTSVRAEHTTMASFPLAG